MQQKLLCLLILAFSGMDMFAQESDWISLFNGQDLSGWTPRGKAHWEVRDGAITGSQANGHLYASIELEDLEIKGRFRISNQGGGSNGGLYFRANPPADNINGYPHGYEAQIANHQKAHTGWLWKPGQPTGKAHSLLTKDDEWFDMRVQAIGPHIKIWINGELVMEHEDHEYQKGYFAIQCHNGGMTIEAKDLYYKNLGNSK